MLAAWSLCAITLAAAPAEFPPDWKHFQSLRLSQYGLLQVSVPIETLDAAQPDLRDLRLYDAVGMEIPFLIERPLPAPLTSRPAAAFRPTMTGDSTVVSITTGRQPLAAVSIETPAPEFLKPVTIEGSVDGSTWTRIGTGEPLFRQFGMSRLQLPLDGKAWGQLRLTLDNRRSAPIAITGVRLHPAAADPVPDEAIDVTMVDREEAGKQTRLTLRLPAANVTLAGLTFRVTDALFTRSATLVLQHVNENEISESALARDTIYRLAANGSAPAEDLKLDAETVVPSREIIVVIDNGDSPPLDITGVTARRRPVFLTFHAVEPGAFHVLSGNPNATAPRYDLAALRGQLRPVRVPKPISASLAANPAWRALEALPDIQPIGTAIELAKWRFRKPITLASSGVQQLELDLDVLARAARSFADLRVVRDDKQLPYLLERTPIERKLTPVAKRADDPKRPTTTVWESKLPQRDLPLLRLECMTAAPLFQRSARLSEEHRDDRGNAYRVSLGGAEWVRTPGQKQTRLSLTLSQPPRTDTLRLEVENGDNPPLELTDFTFWHPATRVLFKADAGPATFLYYGNPEVAAARYDLSLIARQILQAEKSKAALGGEDVLKKPRWSETAEATGVAGWIFWTVLGAVVLVLLIVLAKLLPKPSPPPA